MEEKPIDQLTKLRNEKDRSVNYMAVEAILENPEREEITK